MKVIKLWYTVMMQKCLVVWW